MLRQRVRIPLILVPTMGALHAGHSALIRRARKIAGNRGIVAVSIFVNPAQFRPGEDLSAYPRPFSADAALCRTLGVDILFHPSREQMYPDGFSTFVDETTLSQPLCGSSRPGHFKGVCTVVTKLFNILAPHTAVFGEKDFQQLAIMRQMVRDLNMPVRIVAVNTVRDKDGLALSSRNQYLSEAERRQAPILRRALLAAAGHAREQESTRILKARALRVIQEASLARVDYIDVVDPVSLRPLRKTGSSSLMALAVFFGGTRLIDNILIKPDS